MLLLAMALIAAPDPHYNCYSTVGGYQAWTAECTPLIQSDDEITVINFVSITPNLPDIGYVGEVRNHTIVVRRVITDMRFVDAQGACTNTPKTIHCRAITRDGTVYETRMREQ